MKNKLLPLLLSALAGLLAVNLAWGFAFIMDDRGTGALPIKWPPGAVNIQLKLTSSGNNNFNAAVQASAAAWNAVIGNLQLNAQPASGTTATEPPNSPNEVVFATDVFGEAFGSNTLAVTTTWSRGNERTQADIIFNTSGGRNWGVYDGPTQSGTTDLKRVALHELGHLLGLDHPDEAGQGFSNPQPIMNSHITSNDTLTADDISGAQNLYGPPGPPPNNNFADATALTLSISNLSVTGYNTNATKQTDEPRHAGSAGTRSVWWKWTAPASGSATVDTRGSYFDTALGVYTGTAVNNLNTIGSNDDISETPHIQASSVTFTASSGTTYYFAVDGWDGDCAGITLNLAFTPNQNLPVITAQPASLSVAAGGSATFSVTATNATSYQWSFNNSPISGATSSGYTLNNAQTANAGSYTVAVTGSGGTVVSTAATLTVTTPAPTPNPTPTPAPSSGGGGGGGGAPSTWFYGAISLLALARYLRRR